MFGGAPFPGTVQPSSGSDLLANLQRLSALTSMGGSFMGNKLPADTQTLNHSAYNTVVNPPEASPQLAGFMNWLQAYSANQAGHTPAHVPLPSPFPAAIPGMPAVANVTQDAATMSEASKDGGAAAGDSNENPHKPQVQRRLYQNRESARKCRQRKKAYLQEIEEELRALRKEHEQAKNDKLQAVTAGLAQSTSKVGAEAIAALLQWNETWEELLLKLNRVLNAPSTLDQLKNAVGLCTEHFARRRPLFQDMVKKDVFAVIAGDHVSFEQRLMLWMGGLRPSQALQLMMQRLEESHMLGESKQMGELTRMKASWNMLEEALAMGFDTIKQQIVLSIEPAVVEEAPSPQNLGKLDALRVMLNRAEELRSDCFAELQRLLPLREFSTAITAPLLATTRLRALHDVTKCND